MSDRDDFAELGWLKELYGQDVELTGADGGETYRVLAEFRANGVAYAALQSEEMRIEAEVVLFRMRREGDSVELETIEDDDEYETVSEIFDERFFE